VVILIIGLITSVLRQEQMKEAERMNRKAMAFKSKQERTVSSPSLLSGWPRRHLAAPGASASPVAVHVHVLDADAWPDVRNE